MPIHPLKKMEQCSETSVYKIQTPGNYPEENIQHSEHGKSLKSRIAIYTIFIIAVSSVFPRASTINFAFALTFV